MASSDQATGFDSIIKQRATRSIWTCLIALRDQGLNREGAAIVSSFQAQMDFERELDNQPIAC